MSGQNSSIKGDTGAMSGATCQVIEDLARVTTQSRLSFASLMLHTVTDITPHSRQNDRKD